jgi:putative ABC transport system substrate-binding protein
MRRRPLVLAAAGGWLAACAVGAPLVALAQPSKVWRIGYLSPTRLEVDETRAADMTAFHLGMRERGLLLHRDYVVEVLSADGELSRYAAMVAEFTRRRVDLIIAAGNTAARQAKSGAGQIPVIFVGVGNPVEIGLVQSLAKPGGTITGRTSITQELEPKRLELLREMLPGFDRLGILTVGSATAAASGGAQPAASTPAASHGSQSAQRRGLALLQNAASALGVTLHHATPHTANEIERELDTLLARKPKAALVFDSATTLSRRREIAQKLLHARVPAMFQTRGWTAVGGLASYGAALLEEYRLLATVVEKVLRGTPAGDIPVEQATKIELLINLRTAKSLGVHMPASILIRADEVLE